MKVLRLDIEGLKGIRSLRLDCAPGMNVIAGVNGAGKSTVLQALEIILSWVKARIRLKTGNGYSIPQEDINKSSKFAAIAAKAIDNGHTFDWCIVRYLSAYRGPRQKSFLQDMTLYADRLSMEYLESDGQCNLPMFVKYSVNRSLIDVPVKVHKKHRLDAMSIYEQPLDAGVNLRSFFEWFREREDIENENKVNHKDFTFADRQLAAVRRAITKVMPGFSSLKTRRQKPAGFVLLKNGEEFRVDQLSDGEKCYLTLVGDIARRLAIFNPIGDPLKGEGIILIDELELHLHPGWQVEAIDNLREVFPNCQFFITTHSPHIVQNLHLYPGESDQFLVLKDGDRHEVATAYGKPVDDVLISVFGMESMRPPVVKKAIDKVWQLLMIEEQDSEKLAEAEAELRDMLPADDPLFARIHRQKLINRIPK